MEKSVTIWETSSENSIKDDNGKRYRVVRKIIWIT